MNIFGLSFLLYIFKLSQGNGFGYKCINANKILINDVRDIRNSVAK